MGISIEIPSVGAAGGVLKKRTGANSLQKSGAGVKSRKVTTRENPQKVKQALSRRGSVSVIGVTEIGA